MIDSRKIPLVQTIIGDEEIAAVVSVLRSGQLAAGPKVLEFEQKFAERIRLSYAVAVNSGTAAIHCGLNAIGVAQGDEVITTPFTFAATATPILMQKARPVFVDIDPRTFNADVAAISEAVTDKTRAIVVVDLFGLPADFTGLEKLNERGILSVEDACQAIGARRDGCFAGSLGNIGCFSFYATKNLMTGEGGMVVTDHVDLAKSASRFRQHGQGDRYEYLSLGFNYRMTDIAAAIGIVQLSRLDEITSARRSNARIYDELLADVPGLSIPFVPMGVEHAYHQYSILIDPEQTKNGKTRDQVRAYLADRGVGSGVYYPTPLHENPLFAQLGYSRGSFPIAERVSMQVMALPVHPSLSKHDVEAVAGILREALGSA